MGYTLVAASSVVGLFFGMLLFLEVGRWIATRRMATDPEGASAGHGPVIGAIFSLLGLLIAFSFSGAASRFDARRQLIVQETSAIDKAYYLTDLLPDRTYAAALKDGFRNYLDAELEAVSKLPDLRAAQAARARSVTAQQDIRSKVLAAYQDPRCQPAASVLLPAIGQWIDVSTARTIAGETHPPGAIFGMLAGLALVSSLVAGYGMGEAKSRSWLHTFAFAIVITATIYVIIDLEFPRGGWIRLDSADQSLVALRRSMK